ncbi:hypothetical protein HHL16_09365 [Pseudoflavitalea sp. G-6-1-2]|uniref:hypothetical protein n=1 Tax=Pseudoflavitalea sp. G-6-1-2 TaxID=2728841 RepID=UPI00146F6F19|nr:hypothetical protein [Pseudoflavitalea sp. G-6-1-2]NML21081.1 hypothetical protein [Pseudoflavitalea sp. G-6-1-2]
MRRFRISFLAVIAVLAIGLTAATKADLFKKKDVSVYVCKPGVDFEKIFPTAPGIGGLFIPTGIPVNAPVRNPWVPGTEPINCQMDLGMACIRNGQLATQPWQCDQASQVFCCAERINPPAPCGTIAGGVDFRPYPIRVIIHCKSDRI